LQVLNLHFRSAFLNPHQFCIYSNACIGLHHITDTNVEAEGFFKRVRTFSKSDYQLHIRPHGKSRLPSDGFSLNINYIKSVHTIISPAQPNLLCWTDYCVHTSYVICF
jgi:hypothetical protein